MKKFKEFDLNENLQEFQEKTTIELNFERSIDGRFKLEDATIKYDEKKGFINIDSKNGNIKINTTLVYSYGKENEIMNNRKASIVPFNLFGKKHYHSSLKYH